MSSPATQPTQQWWDDLDPDVLRRIEEKRTRGLADARDGRLTSAKQMKAEMKKHFAEPERKLTP